MWRVEERRRGADWDIIDIEPIENLQLSVPNSVPTAERQPPLTL